jgi:sigma-E factor negative regulatory protein RseC
LTELIPAEMCDADVLAHKGTITEIDGQYYYISIITQSACASCHTKGVCGMIENKEKVIEVSRKVGESYNIGDSVEIIMNKSMGSKAVFIGYIIPFLLLLVTLILSLQFTDNEGIAGIMAIGIVAIYYFALYLLKDKFKNKFRFSIRA